LCVLEWEFSLFCVLEYSRVDRASRCHTHTHTWNVILAARILQYTHAHTPHTVTNAHTRTLSRAHTHAHKDKHMHINTYKHTLTHAHKKTHTRSPHFP